MTDLIVTPERLDVLAAKQDDAAAMAAQAAIATTDLKRNLELTWGPFWRAANDAIARAERDRNNAIKRLRSQCNGDAANLRAAAQAYVNSDTALAEPIRPQDR